MRLSQLVVACLTIAACGGASGPGPDDDDDQDDNVVASLTVDPAVGALLEGGSLTLTATARNAAGATLAGASVTWVSRAPTIASVTAGGSVTGLAEGTTMIVAQAGTTADSAAITVSQAPVSSITISPLPGRLAVGASVPMTAELRDVHGNVLVGRVVTWSSSHPAVVEVSTAGVVTARGAGTATVTAAAEGTQASTTAQVRVRFVSVVTAYAHACALDESGAAYCWGKNHRGQLGDGTRTDRQSPVRVAGNHVFVRLATRSNNDLQGHVCGLTAAGTLYCWGSNENGELGAATVPSGIDNGDAWSAVPVPVQGGHTFSDVSVNSSMSCGITTAGTALCWGYNGWGQLGRGTKTLVEPVPAAVSAAETFASVSAGYRHACALTAAGAAWCWGQNTSYGQVGSGTIEEILAPVPVVGGLTFAQLSAGTFTTCARTSAADGYCWGFNGQGQVGDGTQDHRLVPTAVSGGLAFAQIASTGPSAGITTAGEVYWWGLTNDLNGATSLVPAAGPAGTFSGLSTSYTVMCAITSGPRAVCWGSDRYGVLGNGAAGGSATPVAVDYQF